MLNPSEGSVGTLINVALILDGLSVVCGVICMGKNQILPSDIVFAV